MLILIPRGRASTAPLFCQFPNLIDATWALLVHEQASLCDERWGLFHSENPLADMPLDARLRTYSSLRFQAPLAESVQWKPDILCEILEACT